jgi:hypothetical protein
MMTRPQIEQAARYHDLAAETVIPGVFTEEEKIVVNLGSFRSAVFIMDNETFDFDFDHVYNSATDKRSRQLPKIFRSTK